ncbi:GNAT family N-acetyltransferase [Butyrivibrio sp. JL13D10]|uniref:GNAT family N-acetyltransferase n=1 Tax=Butyrivibrio sp. JL13D10 TaxID=3236815 RepID=UPI0038B5644B
MFNDYYKKLLNQLSLDYNCTPEDLQAKENIITTSKLNEGRRSYSPGKPFLQMVTLGGNTVIMADECLHEFLQQFVKNKEGHWLFELHNLIELNDELKKYGYKMNPTHHMFLPSRKVVPDGEFQVKWLYDSEIACFYGDKRFPNAIAYPAPCPARPDKIVCIAVKDDTIMGMAGCSEDAPHWQQIGIDVLPQYRSKGIGSYLVNLLTNKIIEMGDVPFYGTAASNIQSQNIALNCGFKPAWTETEAEKTEDKKSEDEK